MKVVNMGKKYLDWLCEFVCDKRSRRAFSKLLYTLYLTDFDAVLDRDENRIVDGLALRPRFLSEKKIDPKMESHIFGEKKCSVLELMVALAIRCEDNLMQNPDIGDRTSKWFWVMLHSLGLDNMTDNTYDENKVSYILYTLSIVNMTTMAGADCLPFRTLVETCARSKFGIRCAGTFPKRTDYIFERGL